MHGPSRWRRGLSEFLLLPLMIALGFAVTAAVVAVLDASAGDARIRGWAMAVVPGDSAVGFIAAVATSAATVTSITFSLLLLAAQQTSSSLTPVVFDQFLRRRGNQISFGIFVGWCMFAFIVLATARPDPPPVYGAVLCLLTTVLAFVTLLVLIYQSIDQMRPANVVSSIHELAQRARVRELPLLARTRAVRFSDLAIPVHQVRSTDTGYVVALDVDALDRLVGESDGVEEVLVRAGLGDHVVFGDIVAELVGASSDPELEQQVVDCFVLDDIRDINDDATYAIDQLGNIAWSAASSAQQSPHTAVVAVRAMRDLLVRWVSAGPPPRERDARRSTVVYVDNAVDHTLDALLTVVVVAGESRQVQTCSEVIQALAGLVRVVQDDEIRERLSTTLRGVLPTVIEHAELPDLTVALDDLIDALQSSGIDAKQVDEVRALLRRSTDLLQQ